MLLFMCIYFINQKKYVYKHNNIIVYIVHYMQTF